jgi:serine/threonine-protein kinase
MPEQEPIKLATLAPSESASSILAAIDDPFIGKVIDGRYVVEGILGEGGMGVVYRGRHKVIEKRVAIKILRDDMAKDAEIMARFLQEARAASAIGNPHIVDVSDFGQLPDRSTYFVMEYLDGQSLASVLSQSERPLPIERILHIVMQLARGLGAAHDANIVHRDLKPDNIMLVTRSQERDFVKILDFGIAKVGSGATAKTKAGSVFGTPHYMSPEQAAGTPVDQRTDIYSLGVILYEMASGRVPFDADNFMGILTQHMYKAPVPIRALVPDISVSPGLEAVILKCLTKKPEGRYASMSELHDDLLRLEQGRVPRAVDDLMARSGGFNVPADYFRSSGLPLPVPGVPYGGRGRPRWQIVLGVGALAMGVGVGMAFILAKSGPTAAQSPHGASSVGQGFVSSSAVVPAPSGKEVRREVVKKVVLVNATPGTRVERDGVSLGVVPVNLTLEADEKAKLTLSLAGYKTEVLEVTADRPKVEVALTRAAALQFRGVGARPKEPPQVPDRPVQPPPKPPPDDEQGRLERALKKGK